MDLVRSKHIKHHKVNNSFFPGLREGMIEVFDGFPVIVLNANRKKVMVHTINKYILLTHAWHTFGT
jgi:hypothetical protein